MSHVCRDGVIKLYTTEVYGKNAYHKKLIQNYKKCFKNFNEHFALLASVEAFWSLKK